MKLISSNANKLREYKRFGMEDIELSNIKDILEIDSSDPVEVIIYKAHQFPNNTLVEDTSLHIEGERVGTSVKWMLNNISSFVGKKATWEVLIGQTLENEILIYRGSISGLITNRLGNKELGYGFESFFIPEGTTKTLYELELEGKKDLFSARKVAVDNFIKTKIYKIIDRHKIKKWLGNYQ